jgi:hypothetical protein
MYDWWGMWLVYANLPAVWECVNIPGSEVDGKRRPCTQVPHGFDSAVPNRVRQGRKRRRWGDGYILLRLMYRISGLTTHLACDRMIEIQI